MERHHSSLSFLSSTNPQKAPPLPAILSPMVPKILSKNKTLHTALPSLQVLTNPDLLYQILSHAPAFDLFTHRYVHPTWYHLISTSTTLLNILHYRTPSDVQIPSHLIATKNVRLNPVLKHHLPMFLQSSAWVDPWSFTSQNLSITALSEPKATFRAMPILINHDRPITKLYILEERLVRMGFHQRRGVLDFEEARDGQSELNMGNLADLCLEWVSKAPRERSFVVRFRKDVLVASSLEEEMEKPSATGRWWPRSREQQVVSSQDRESVRGPIAAVTKYISRIFKPTTTNTRGDETWQSPKRYMSKDFYALPVPFANSPPMQGTLLEGPKLIEVCLFEVSDVRSWFTDIMDEFAVVPGEWDVERTKGQFEGVEGGWLGRVKWENDRDGGWSIIIHSLRTPIRSPKWRAEGWVDEWEVERREKMALEKLRREGVMDRNRLCRTG